MKTINIAKDFTAFPAGRLKSTGKGSGEEFREKFLLPALEAGEPIEIVLDGTTGYPPSFLEEAFGGLVRLGYSQEKIWNTFTLRAGPTFEVYELAARQYVSQATER